jgi:hypothetical protein
MSGFPCPELMLADGIDNAQCTKAGRDNGLESLKISNGLEEKFGILPQGRRDSPRKDPSI